MVHGNTHPHTRARARTGRHNMSRWECETRTVELSDVVGAMAVYTSSSPGIAGDGEPWRRRVTHTCAVRPLRVVVLTWYTWLSACTQAHQHAHRSYCTHVHIILHTRMHTHACANTHAPCGSVLLPMLCKEVSSLVQTSH